MEGEGEHHVMRHIRAGRVLHPDIADIAPATTPREAAPSRMAELEQRVQTLEEEEVPQEEEATAALSMKRARRKKLQHVSKEKPKPVGDEMVAKAQKKDLRRRRLE